MDKRVDIEGIAMHQSLAGLEMIKMLRRLDELEARVKQLEEKANADCSR